MNKVNITEEAKNYISGKPYQDMNDLDYIYNVFRTIKLPDDFILSLSHLFLPEMITLNDYIFLKQEFKQDVYDDYIKQGMPYREIQSWMNNIVITDLFENITYSNAVIFANSLTVSWNLVIQDKFPKGIGYAKTLEDFELDEVYIVID
jgi:hypothetical protein